MSIVPQYSWNTKNNYLSNSFYCFYYIGYVPEILCFFAPSDFTTYLWYVNWHIYDNVNIFNWVNWNKMFEDNFNLIKCKNIIALLKNNTPFAKVSSLTDLSHVFWKLL